MRLESDAFVDQKATTPRLAEAKDLPEERAPLLKQTAEVSLSPGLPVRPSHSCWRVTKPHETLLQEQLQMPVKLQTSAAGLEENGAHSVQQAAF